MIQAGKDNLDPYEAIVAGLSVALAKPSDEIPREKIEGILKLPVSFTIPNDYPVVISSVNRGKLLHEIAPDKEVTRSFRRMADLLLGPVSVQKPVSGERKRGLFGRLFPGERRSK